MTKQEFIEELEKYEYGLQETVEGDPFWKAYCYGVLDRLYYDEGRIDENEYERFQVMLAIVDDDSPTIYTYKDLIDE